jgi:uracil-DNA glycosylase
MFRICEFTTFAIMNNYVDINKSQNPLRPSRFRKMTEKKPRYPDPFADAILARLEDLQRAGITELPKAALPPTEQPPAPTDLDAIRCQVESCQKCKELADTRTQTVFGDGNPNARLVFLGEAPGADEDRQGVPFVGRAGKLLDKIIEACTLSREQIYILNILKCRPPGNRNPSPAESANCREFLDAQLAMINPEFICCLGSVAAKNLLETDTPIGKMRGSFHEYKGIRVLCTYHPAYLLRNPPAKRDVWEDMKLLMAEMGIKL